MIDLDTIIIARDWPRLRERGVCYGDQLWHKDLSGAKLSGMDLSNSHLTGSNLSGADLSFTNLSGTRLSGCDLENANLEGANISGVEMSNVNLTGANLLDVITDTEHTSADEINDVKLLLEKQPFIEWKFPESWTEEEGKIEVASFAKHILETAAKIRLERGK